MSFFFFFQGTGSVLGISFNMSESRELLVLKERAFSGMDNLQFLRFYKQWSDKARLRLHEGLDCLPLPRKLKLLHWDACPMEHLSLKFNPECLIEINMKESKLKKLWEGVPVSFLTVLHNFIPNNNNNSDIFLFPVFAFRGLGVSKR